MKKAIAWLVEGGQRPQRLPPGTIDLEQRLEDWVEADIGIVAEEVMLIGRQVPTSYGTVIDLLGIDADGNLVVIELKRDQTLRETVAQGIEYAAWVSKCLYDDVCAIAAKQHGTLEKFAAAFEQRFGHALLDTLNDGQRILLVAPEITDSTAAVIEYLSETFHLPINAVSFDVFALDGRQIVVRHFIREESVVEPPPGKKQKSRTLEQFVSAAHENGVGELVEHILSMRDLLPSVERYWQSFALKTRTPDRQRSLAAFTVYPTAETNQGSVDVLMDPGNLTALYGAPLEHCTGFVKEIQSLGSPRRGWAGWLGTAFTTIEQVKEFDRRFRAFAA
ncbi:MAG: hypothetical protein H0T39_15420, partial [Actinobacteria bacterium]|nr:hypothetical protein [Actinomycetota bacterium]